MRPDAPLGPPDQGKAVATVNELGHLASGVGHHVINAFSAVVSNAEILRLRLSSPDAPDPVALAEAIIKTAVEAAAVARRLIDVSRPMTSVGDARVALDDLIVAYAAARNAQGATLARWTASPTPVPPIVGDVEHLAAMLDHLSNNAIEAAGPGGVEIRLSTAVDPGGWVVLEVRDAGLGMTDGAIERAVEPFFSTKSGHLGVGLTIANGIWRRHKGFFAVRSVPGEGTTIRLSVEPAR